MSFAVVEFLGDSSSEANTEVAVVPSKWITDDRLCYWPRRTGNKKFEEFVKELPLHKTSWSKFKIQKILFKTDNYEAAENFLSNFLDENVSSVSSKSVRKEIGEPNEIDDNDLNILENTCLDEVAGGSSFSLVARPLSATSSTNISSSTPTLSSGLEKTILEELCRLNAVINQQSTMLTELLRNSRVQMVDACKSAPADIPNFPLRTMEEFENLNAKITEEHMSRYMVSRLSAVGGSGLEGLTRRMMKFLMTDQLASKFNWKGRGDKISFEKCSLASVLIEAGKRNFPEGEKSDLVIADTIKLWLKYAPTRINRGKI